MNLAAKVVENPEILATLSESEIRGIMGTLTMVTAAAHAKWLTVLEAEKATKQIAQGDRLLGVKEIAERLGCSVSALVRRARAGKYGFMFMHGGNWAGSENGPTRWIAARVKSESRS